MHFRPAIALLAPIALLVALPKGRSQTAETLETTLQRVDASAATFRSMSAGIRKLSHTDIINEDNVESGTILIKRPRPHDMRVLINLTQPDPKAVAISGRSAEVYFPKIQTVQVYDIGKSRELFDEFFLVGFGSTRKELEAAYHIKFMGTATVNGQKSTQLEMIPKSKQVLAHLKRFELWVSADGPLAGYPLQQKFFTSGKDYIMATYTDLKINPSLSDAALKLTLPRNVKREYPQK